MENQNQQEKLHSKEKKRQTAREKVNPGGRAIEATGDNCMAAIKGIQIEREAVSAAKHAQQAAKGWKGVAKGMSAADKSLRKTLHQDAVAAWKAEWMRLRDNGLVMKGAGPKPRLWWYMEAANPYNITLPSWDHSMLASTSSHPRCQTHCVIYSPVTPDVEIDDALYVDNAKN